MVFCGFMLLLKLFYWILVILWQIQAWNASKWKKNDPILNLTRWRLRPKNISIALHDPAGDEPRQAEELSCVCFQVLAKPEVEGNPQPDLGWGYILESNAAALAVTKPGCKTCLNQRFPPNFMILILHGPSSPWSVAAGEFLGCVFYCSLSSLKPKERRRNNSVSRSGFWIRLFPGFSCLGPRGLVCSG